MRKNNLQVEKLPVGQLNTNCYLVHQNKKCLVVDPGDAAELISRRIKELDLSPQAIIATHAHFDHIAAVNELRLAFQIPFLMDREDELLLKWFRKSTLYFTKVDPGPPPKVDEYLNSKTKVFAFKIIKTPGHTPGSVCLYSKENKIVFVGDLIFAGGGIGRTDFSYSNKQDLKKSIKKVTKLPKEIVVYPGHGEPTTIGEFTNAIQKWP